jgi:hypothetical protein
MNMPLEDYWDKPRTITARQLAEALHEWLFTSGGDYFLLRFEGDQHAGAAAIIAAIPETADRGPTPEDAGPSGGLAQPNSTCRPRGHRYDRIGMTDRLRCRRCGWERAG